MSADAAVQLTIDAFEEPRPVRDDQLVVDVEGFEGPLDLLLKLARDQKVDLAKISILALAEQYLSFIDEARRLRLEIAADYLVMAAWLAFLKSRLLLPDDDEEDAPSGEELAAVLAARLKHLEAIREAGRRLLSRPRLDVDIFPRGLPEGISVLTASVWDAKLYDLLAAYGALRLRRVVSTVRISERRGLLAAGGSRAADPPARHVDALGAARLLPDRISRAARMAAHGTRQRAVGEPRNGAQRARSS